MTTTEKNVLIAEFIDGELRSPATYEPYYRWYQDDAKTLVKRDSTISRLIFHQSWNWLIPVLEKIEDLLYASYVDYDVTVQDFFIKWSETNTKTLQYTNDQLKFGTDINEVYDDVIDFINFYNKYTNEM